VSLHATEHTDSDSYLPPNSDGVFELEDLYDELTKKYLADGTGGTLAPSSVTARLVDAAGDAVAIADGGGTWPKALAYVEGTRATWTGLLPRQAAVEEGVTYFALVVVTISGAEREFTTDVVIRRSAR